MMRTSHALPLIAATLFATAAFAQQTSLSYRYEYDARGNLTRIVNGADAAHSATYDALGRRVTLTDPLGHATTLTHDGRDQLTRVLTPNGATTHFQVDGRGFLGQESGADRGVVSYQRDRAGLPVVRTDARGARRESSFDALGRPVEHRFLRPDGSVERSHVLSWDSGPHGIGRLGSIDTGENRLDFAYDAYGRLVTRSYTSGAVSLATDWDYHPTSGRVSALAYPSGAVLSYGYDAAGRLVSMVWEGTPVAEAIEYEPFGPVSGFTLANGIDHLRSFDRAGRVIGYSAAGEAVDTLYDAAGNLVEADPIASPGRRQQFAYDAAGRLTGYSDTASVLAYSYDGNGNRLGQTVNGQSLAYGYLAQSNRLLAVGTQSYTYDAAGNLISDGLRTLAFDAAGRLASATRSFASASYQYNGLGERSRKVSGTLTRHYVYDAAGHLIGEYDENGAPVVEYAWLGDVPVAMRATPAAGPAEIYAIETDHLGTPRLVTDALQRVRWRWHSAPFGNSAPDENPSGLGSLSFNLRFPGQYHDTETGLNYNYFRDYDPATGRYVESDPIGIEGGINTYSYVQGNPVSDIDPLGLAACVVSFPDYPIDTGFGFTSSNLGGHGGVLSYDSQGSTRFYEYGRYSPSNQYVIGDKRPELDGNVRRVPIPDLVIDPKTGQPTPDSLEALRKALSDRAGHKTRTELTCDQNADETKVNKWAEDFAKNSSRPKYSWKPWSSNQCRDFAKSAYGAGR